MERFFVMKGGSVVRNDRTGPASAGTGASEPELNGAFLPGGRHSTGGPLVIQAPEDEAGAMDEDLEPLTREQLAAEVRKLRAGIRAHRDSTAHELCWHHPLLWQLRPSGRIRFRSSRNGRSSSAAVSIPRISLRELPDAPRTAEEFDPER